MTPQDFHALLHGLTAQLQGRPIDSSLQTWLNAEHGPDSPPDESGSNTYQQLKAACETGVAQGWLCQREAGGLKYGRIFKPDDGLHRFSVDVVDMTDVAGPHHVHPTGEIDLVMRARDGTLVFVEVRSRSSQAFGGAGASISATKQQRIVFAARQYLMRLPSPPPCRFDVVLVQGASVSWLQAAFDAQ